MTFSDVHRNRRVTDRPSDAARGKNRKYDCSAVYFFKNANCNKFYSVNEFYAMDGLNRTRNMRIVVHDIKFKYFLTTLILIHT